VGVLQKQYIKDDNGTHVGVILAIAEYQALIERLDELEDIIAYNKAKAEPSDPMPFKDFLKQLENPI
jgi:hypothetical protein